MSTSSRHTKRQLSHVRLITLLIISLNTLDIKISNINNQQLEKFTEDINYCRRCFEKQWQSCRNFMKDIAGHSDDSLWWNLVTLLPQRTCKRNNHMRTISETGDKVIAKYFANDKDYLKWMIDCKELQKIFLNQERLDGVQFHPPHRINEFVDALHLHHRTLPKETIWLYLLVNSQPILMPILYAANFPVPKTYAVCGFTVYQEYAGIALYKLYGKDFKTKLKIAKQLIEAALKFSYGFENYRFYITDLTADNIVYDIDKGLLSFVDLDTVFVVDFRAATYKSAIHKHEYIECPGCFAYSPEDIASHNISDINIYSACQFLREDLYKDETKGFLYPIPDNITKKYPLILDILNRCVDCPTSKCWERFSIAKELLNILEDVLNDINNNNKA